MTPARFRKKSDRLCAVCRDPLKPTDLTNWCAECLRVHFEDCEG